GSVSAPNGGTDGGRVRGVEALNDALNVALADGCRVRVHGVEQHLNRRRPSSVEIPCEIGRTHDARIDRAEADVPAEHIHGLVDALQLETAALTERGDQIAAR